jgi:hypothetical protein
MKQTAVEWLYSFMLIPLSQWPDDMWAQAKAMEKEQIIKACDAGFDDANLFIEDMKYQSAEHYYTETYGGKDEL